MAAWQPGELVKMETALKPVFSALGWSQGDMASFTSIAEKLAERNVTSFGDLFGGGWTRDELLSCLKGLPNLLKAAQSYVGAIESAVQQAMPTSRALAVPDVKVKRGGNTSAACIKVEPSSAFVPSTYTPDGRVYAPFTKKGFAAHMDQKQYELYIDLLWLAIMLDPEDSIGDYLQKGMPERLATLHDLLLPPFAPTGRGSLSEKPKCTKKTINLRFQNGREIHYGRIKLDEKFREYFQPKALAKMGDASFVPAGDDRLKDNARNDFVETMVKVRSGELPVSHSPAPLAHPASGTLSLPVRVMTDWPTVHVHSATTSPGFQSTPRIAASPTRKVCTYVAVAHASLPPKRTRAARGSASVVSYARRAASGQHASCEHSQKHRQSYIPSMRAPHPHTVPSVQPEPEPEP